MRERACHTAVTRPAVVLRVPALLVLLLLVVPSLSCAGQTRESAFAREFERLHGVTDPGMLTVVEAAPESVARTIRRDLPEDFLVLLPGYLPADFELAAPFRGTGSGSALPNPHTWGDGYAVTYTDGRARLTVMVNPDEPVNGGEWEETAGDLKGSPLLVQDRDGLVLVSTAPDAGGPVVVVVGERVDRPTVVAVAEGLRDPREP